jgi:hypothetical protein
MTPLLRRRFTTPQTTFIDEAAVVVAAVMPEVETAHHHGAIREIDHGAGPIGGDQLAVVDFAEWMIAGGSRCSHDDQPRVVLW